jgi:hypothetical protein
MSRMNAGRVILGGIVAGIVGDILAGLVDGWLLAPRWAAGMRALGHYAFTTKQMIAFNLLGIVFGIAAVWIYAAIRPRFGAGVKTAIYAGLVVWIVGFLVPNASYMYVSHLFPRGLTAYTTLGALVEVVVATIAGAALYKESEATVTEMAGAKTHVTA